MLDIKSGETIVLEEAVDCPDFIFEVSYYDLPRLIRFFNSHPQYWYSRGKRRRKPYTRKFVLTHYRISGKISKSQYKVDHKDSSYLINVYKFNPPGLDPPLGEVWWMDFAPISSRVWIPGQP